MLCELCAQNEATVHFKQAQDGDVREMHICQECAAKHGLNLDAPFSLTDLLFGLEKSGGSTLVPGEPDPACPHCHMRRSDFRRTSRLGCGRCYETFVEDIAPFLADMQNGDQHRGKVPARQRVPAEIAALEEQLRLAVERQDFEAAADLRDRVRALRHQAPVADARGVAP